MTSKVQLRGGVSLRESLQLSTAAADKPVGIARWIVVFATFVIAAVSYLDRNNIAIAASSIQHEFHLSNVQLGGVFSAFILGYALSQPFAGRLADRFGSSRSIAAGILWWSLFTALLPAIPPTAAGALVMIVVVRLLLGIGEAIIFPASNRLVASWIPSRERGIANGIIFAGVGLGGTLAPPIMTFIMIRHTWRDAFWVCSVIGATAGVLWMFLVRNNPDAQKHMSAEERAYIAAGMPQRNPRSASTVRWLDVVFDRQILALTLSYFCYGYVAYIFFTWFFKYLSDVRGLNLMASAVYTMLPFIAMTVASPLGGWISDKLLPSIGKRAARCGVAGFSLLAASIAVWAAMLVSDVRVAALVLAGGAGALYLAQSAFWALSADIGGNSAGLVSGVMNMGGQLGGVCTAALTPVIARSLGWSASFTVTAGICLLGAIIWIFIDPFHRLETR